MSVSGGSEVSDTEVTTEEQDSTAEVSQLSETEEGGSETENETTTANSEQDNHEGNDEVAKEAGMMRDRSLTNTNLMELTRPESMTFAPTFDEYDGEDGPLAWKRGSQFQKNSMRTRSSNFQDYDELYGEMGYDSGEDEQMETAEELLDYQNHKQRLINKYINTKGIYKYFTKKNAFLQDKLYKICVRKSFIVENKGGPEEEKTSKYHRRRKRLSTSAGMSSKAHRDRTESGEMDEDVIETEELPEDKADKFPRITAFLEAALESKYRRVVQAILAAEKSKDDDAAVWDNDLIRLREKNDRVEQTHLERISSLMERIKSVSEIATDSNTGRRIPKWETDQYIEEVTRIHQKFVQTLTRLYQNRHGLVFALQRLQETEFQGEGLQMLEYEQLQAENYSLKDKLEDRQKDLDHIKEKIAHAVQILAHFRECMSKLKEKLEAGTNKLDHINSRVYQVKQKTDEVTQRYEAVKAEESTLVQESGLLDNIRLLRDFEKTHYSNLKTRETKRNLKKKIAYRARETRTLQMQIKDIALRLPQLKLQQQREVPASTALADDSNVSQAPTEPIDDEVAWNAQLQWLLSQRCQDPLFSSAETCSARRAGKLWQLAENQRRFQPPNTVY